MAGTAQAARGEAGSDALRALVGQTVVDDDGPLLRQAEKARARIALRRPRRDRADLGEAEAEAVEQAQGAAALVPAGGESDGVGEAQPGDLGREAGFVPLQAGARKGRDC